MKRALRHRDAPKGIPWSEIAALLKKGWEPRDIAMKYGCSVQNIYARIARHRAQKPNGKQGAA